MPLLLSKDADPNKAAIDEEDVANTPLYLAASDGSIELVKNLLASGADPNKGYRSADENCYLCVESPLHKAIGQSNSTEIVRSLLEGGADPNEGERRSSYKDVVTPLYKAAWQESTEVVRILLASGARQDLDTGG